MMKKIFSVAPSQNLDVILLVVRVTIAALMLVHGLPKLIKLFSDGPVEFANVWGMGAGLSLTLAVFAEVLCSVFLLLGLGTRVAVIPLIITMLVAVFHIHANDPFIRQEMGLHYILVYALLLVTGSGKYSVDYLMEKKFSDYRSVITTE